MADQDKSALAPVFPRYDIPVIYFDGVEKASWNHDTVRMYFAYLAPALNDSTEEQLTAAAIGVTSVSGFLNAARFFNGIVRRMHEKGVITDEMARNAMGVQSDGETPNGN